MKLTDDRQLVPTSREDDGQWRPGGVALQHDSTALLEMQVVHHVDGEDVGVDSLVWAAGVGEVGLVASVLHNADEGKTGTC